VSSKNNSTEYFSNEKNKNLETNQKYNFKKIKNENMMLKSPTFNNADLSELINQTNNLQLNQLAFPSFKHPDYRMSAEA
jgi:hypothetical protein